MWYLVEETSWIHVNSDMSFPRVKIHVISTCVLRQISTSIPCEFWHVFPTCQNSRDINLCFTPNIHVYSTCILTRLFRVSKFTWFQLAFYAKYPCVFHVKSDTSFPRVKIHVISTCVLSQISMCIPREMGHVFSTCQNSRDFNLRFTPNIRVYSTWRVRVFSTWIPRDLPTGKLN